MRALALALLLNGCQTPAPTFNPAALQPAAEDAQPAVLAGYLHVGDGGLRLYPTQAALTAGSKDCLSILALSTAGVPTREFHGRLMAVTGALEKRAIEGCSAALAIIASDISVP